MVLIRKITDSQGYLTAGSVFFLVGIFASMVGDGRLIGAFFAGLISDKSLLHTIQGFAGGISIPMFFASIYFYLRSISMRRPR
jgi:Kef-type K+ transport system membrane component KefB